MNLAIFQAIINFGLLNFLAKNSQKMVSFEYCK